MRTRPFRGPWLRRNRALGRGGQLLLSVLLGLVAALFLIHQFDASLRPYLVAITQSKLQNELTLIAGQAAAQAMEEQPISALESSGEVTAIFTDTARLNRLRSSILDTVIYQVNSLDSRSLGVPLGALTGLDLLSALGPPLPVQVLSVASAEGNYRNEFTSAGINQVLYRVLLDVTVTVKLLMPGGIEETQVSTPVCIAETVIIGQVPQGYLTLHQ